MIEVVTGGAHVGARVDKDVSFYGVYTKLETGLSIGVDADVALRSGTHGLGFGVGHVFYQDADPAFVKGIVDVEIGRFGFERKRAGAGQVGETETAAKEIKTKTAGRN
jgi:hypothetical protein